ncbi:MAG: PDZ domain-containing protein, partial [Myxococcota bacterium]
FAVPANLARRVAKQIIDDGSVRRAWIGVRFQSLTPELASHFGLGDGAPHGALVSGVTPGGPAAEAGLEAGDVILSVDGTAIRKSHDLLRQVLRKPVGARLELGVLRDGEKHGVTLVTGERPSSTDERSDERRHGSSADPSASYGLRLAELTPELAQRAGLEDVDHGVVVVAVAQGHPAARAGLRRGDVIVEADKKTVDDPSVLESALEDGKAVLRVRRNDGSFYTVLEKDG